MPSPNEGEVREALRKMIEVLKKYNIRFVLNTLVVIIGAVAGTIYVFGRRLINWFRGFMG